MNCAQLFQPPADLGKTNALVSDVLNACEVVSQRVESNRVRIGLLDADISVAGVDEPVISVLEGDGTETDPLRTNVIIPFHQNATFGGTEDFGVSAGVPLQTGLFWCVFGFDTYDGVLQGVGPPYVFRFVCPVALKSVVMQTSNYNTSTPGDMYITVFEPDGSTLIPSIYSPSPVPGVNLDNAGTFPAAQGEIEYEFLTPLPPNTPFIVLVTTENSADVEGKFILYGTQSA
jgi:hypothetical protein